MAQLPPTKTDRPITVNFCDVADPIYGVFYTTLYMLEINEILKQLYNLLFVCVLFDHLKMGMKVAVFILNTAHYYDN